VVFYTSEHSQNKLNLTYNPDSNLLDVTHTIISPIIYIDSPDITADGHTVTFTEDDNGYVFLQVSFASALDGIIRIDCRADRDW
jgi:hypothetical protein